MNKITFNAYDKKIRFTVSHSSTTDLQFTLPVPTVCDFDLVAKDYKYLSESLKNIKKTQYYYYTLKLEYAPKLLSTTQLGYLESLLNYSMQNIYTIKIKPDAVSTYEPIVRIDNVDFKYEKNQHRLITAKIEITITDGVAIQNYSLI